MNLNEIIGYVKGVLGLPPLPAPALSTSLISTKISFKGRKKLSPETPLSNGTFLKHLKGLSRNKMLMELSWSKSINTKLKFWLLQAGLL